MRSVASRFGPVSGWGRWGGVGRGGVLGEGPVRVPVGALSVLQDGRSSTSPHHFLLDVLG